MKFSFEFKIRFLIRQSVQPHFSFHLHITTFSQFYFYHIKKYVLMFKVTHPGHYHYKSFFLTKLYAVFIADRSTGLDKS